VHDLIKALDGTLRYEHAVSAAEYNFLSPLLLEWRPKPLYIFWWDNGGNRCWLTVDCWHHMHKCCFHLAMHGPPDPHWSSAA
jgi:hypothetical protein